MTDDLVVFGDGDAALLRVPLLADPSLVLVKGRHGVDHLDELLGRPVVGSLFPGLEHVRQPLSDTFAVRRSALQRTTGVGPAFALEVLLGVAERYGGAAIVEVDLAAGDVPDVTAAEAREILRVALCAVSG